MIRRPPRSTLFPYTTLLPISDGNAGSDILDGDLYALNDRPLGVGHSSSDVAVVCLSERCRRHADGQRQPETENGKNSTLQHHGLPFRIGLKARLNTPTLHSFQEPFVANTTRRRLHRGRTRAQRYAIPIRPRVYSRDVEIPVASLVQSNVNVPYCAPQLVSEDCSKVAAAGLTYRHLRRAGDGNAGADIPCGALSLPTCLSFLPRNGEVVGPASSAL